VYQILIYFCPLILGKKNKRPVEVRCNRGKKKKNSILIWTRRDEQRRKCSKMDKRAKDKLIRSPRENGGG